MLPTSRNLLTRPRASSKTMDSFFLWPLQNTKIHICDFEIPLKGLATQTLLFVTPRLPFEGLDHQHLWWLEKVATSTIPNLEIFQGITPVENMRELFRNKTLLSLKSLIKTCLGFPLYTGRSRLETLILNGLEQLFGFN